MKTLAAVLVETKRPLELMELETPALKTGQALVEIHYSGICGSQINEIQGTKGPDKYLPHTLGHEGSGIVLESNCSKVKPGDHVVVSWIKGDGEDAGPIKYGHVNSGPVSTFLTHAVISENRLTPIPNDFPLKDAALLGCAIPTGAGIVFNQLDLQPGQSLAIFGMGGIGMAALLAAVSRGVTHITCCDRDADRNARARMLGATMAGYAIWPFGYHDAVIECSGNPTAIQRAVESVMPLGKCVLVGNPPHGTKVQIDPYDLIAGRTLTGSWGGNSHLDRDTPRYMTLPMHQLLGEEYPLTEINEALKNHGKGGRTILKCAH